jgi:hypothetical protein
MAGVASLFAVTHQGPAQGGKAGGSKLPGTEYSKNLRAWRKKCSTNCRLLVNLYKHMDSGESSNYRLIGHFMQP